MLIRASMLLLRRPATFESENVEQTTMRRLYDASRLNAKQSDRPNRAASELQTLLVLRRLQARLYCETRTAESRVTNEKRDPDNDGIACEIWAQRAAEMQTSRAENEPR